MKRWGYKTDLEFQQNKLKTLNKKFNVEMFRNRARGGKAYATEQKIREFKKLFLKAKNYTRQQQPKG